MRLPPGRIRSARAVEGAMPRKNLLNKSVPRVEYDYRAREARLQIEQLERLLVRRLEVKNFRLFRRFRLLAFSVSGAGRGDRGTGSPSDRRPCGMSAPLLAPSMTGPDVVSWRNPFAYARQNFPIGSYPAHRKAPRALPALRQRRDIAQRNPRTGPISASGRPIERPYAPSMPTGSRPLRSRSEPRRVAGRAPWIGRIGRPSDLHRDPFRRAGSA